MAVVGDGGRGQGRSVGSSFSGGVRPPDCQGSPKLPIAKPCQARAQRVAVTMVGRYDALGLTLSSDRNIDDCHDESAFVISTRCVNAMRPISPTSPRS